ncbi:hypothetical protein EDEG_01440 [Edhazardia aedis USNM 41457]|uniref:PIN domain-containing protein n=1 Tax=Edhazardia aedis (strain USNM 41457) TaxID=1003232 RepID=J8ZX80_EDHAE|nr:hypothetical protein EDEG_01440 [Edhazardia aedis USNM 41457]|eukprot:EJW04293.1 hypothetical protein EDEG_01440 [Edhazardia aedis USNM 41457]
MSQIKLIPDTNVLMNYYDELAEALANTTYCIFLYVPRIVLQELDNLKIKKHAARKAINMIKKTKEINKIYFETGDYSCKMDIENNVKTDINSYIKNEKHNNDDKILKFADDHRDFVFITCDRSLYLKTEMYSLRAICLEKFDLSKIIEQYEKLNNCTGLKIKPIQDENMHRSNKTFEKSDELREAKSLLYGSQNKIDGTSKQNTDYRQNGLLINGEILNYHEPPLNYTFRSDAINPTNMISINTNIQNTNRLLRKNSSDQFEIPLNDSVFACLEKKGAHTSTNYNHKKPNFGHDNYKCTEKQYNSLFHTNNVSNHLGYYPNATTTELYASETLPNTNISSYSGFLNNSMQKYESNPPPINLKCNCNNNGIGISNQMPTNFYRNNNSKSVDHNCKRDSNVIYDSRNTTIQVKNPFSVNNQCYYTPQNALQGNYPVSQYFSYPTEQFLQHNSNRTSDFENYQSNINFHNIFIDPSYHQQADLAKYQECLNNEYLRQYSLKQRCNTPEVPLFSGFGMCNGIKNTDDVNRKIQINCSKVEQKTLVDKENNSSDPNNLIISSNFSSYNDKCGDKIISPSKINIEADTKTVKSTHIYAKTHNFLGIQIDNSKTTIFNKKDENITDKIDKKQLKIEKIQENNVLNESPAQDFYKEIKYRPSCSSIKKKKEQQNNSSDGLLKESESSSENTNNSKKKNLNEDQLRKIAYGRLKSRIIETARKDSVLQKKLDNFKITDIDSIIKFTTQNFRIFQKYISAFARKKLDDIKKNLESANIHKRCKAIKDLQIVFNLNVNK